MFEVTKIIPVNEGEYLYIEFRMGRRGGHCDYYVFGDDPGIDDCVYNERDDEDIYDEIHSWVQEHIYCARVTTVHLDGELIPNNIPTEVNK